MRKTQIIDNEDPYESEPEYLANYKSVSKNKQELIEEINEIIKELRYSKVD